MSVNTKRKIFQIEIHILGVKWRQSDITARYFCQADLLENRCQSFSAFYSLQSSHPFLRGLFKDERITGECSELDISNLKFVKYNQLERTAGRKNKYHLSVPLGLGLIISDLFWLNQKCCWIHINQTWRQTERNAEKKTEESDQNISDKQLKISTWPSVFSHII